MKTKGFKKTELRLGNLGIDREGRICIVEELRYDEEPRISAIKGGLTSLPVEPIPLTEEIMLSMGLMIRPELTPQEAKSNISLWHRNSFFIFHDADNNFCAIDLLNTFELERKTTICYYVHQLQNLIFALTGEELEINL